MRTLLLCLVGFACVAMSVRPVVAAAPIAPVVRSFGLFGEWSPNCTAPASPKNPYVIWRGQPDGGVVRQLLATQDGMANVAYVKSGERLGPNRLMLVLDDPPLIFKIVIEMAGKRWRTLRSVAADGRILIDNGIFAANRRPVPWFARCYRR